MVDDWAPLLSAKWINTRISHVFDQSIEIFEKLIDQLTESGYLPMEAPLAADLDSRLTPEQKVALGLAEEPQEQLALL